ncbi:MAG: hypothetical protein K9G70_13230 [Prolixibacteraceae bacterium]|nr:hypothetical protein [Prolixibacteraceae bacterium]
MRQIDNISELEYSDLANCNGGFFWTALAALSVIAAVCYKMGKDGQSGYSNAPEELEVNAISGESPSFT